MLLMEMSLAGIRILEKICKICEKSKQNYERKVSFLVARWNLTFWSRECLAIVGGINLKSIIDSYKAWNIFFIKREKCKKQYAT